MMRSFFGVNRIYTRLLHKRSDLRTARRSTARNDSSLTTTSRCYDDQNLSPLPRGISDDDGDRGGARSQGGAAAGRGDWSRRGLARLPRRADRSLAAFSRSIRSFSRSHAIQDASISSPDAHQACPVVLGHARADDGGRAEQRLRLIIVVPFVGRCSGSSRNTRGSRHLQVPARVARRHSDAHLQPSSRTGKRGGRYRRRQRATDLGMERSIVRRKRGQNDLSIGSRSVGRKTGRCRCDREVGALDTDGAETRANAPGPMYSNIAGAFWRKIVHHGTAPGTH